MTNNNPESPGFASPPCFAHEFDTNGYAEGLNQDGIDVANWRKIKRTELIATCHTISAPERKRVAGEVANILDELIDFSSTPIVSVYWPFRGELNLRDWMHAAHNRGGRIALPVVVAKAQPLVFREWSPGCKMEKGIWNIPVPADSAIVTPTIVISPLVGYDPDCFRLGYGGGFFDRTLAALPLRPLMIGVGHPCIAIPTIYPQPHDIPMDAIVVGKNSVIYRT